MIVYCLTLSGLNLPLSFSSTSSRELLSQIKWNESGFRPPLCKYRLNWARRTFWGWWDDWYDTVLQTQDSKFEPWRSEAELATSRSRRLPTILTFTRGWGRNNFVSFKPPRPGTEPRTLAWKAAVLTTTLGPQPNCCRNSRLVVDENDLKWVANEENISLLLKQYHGNVRSKFPRCRDLSHSSEKQNQALMHREGSKG